MTPYAARQHHLDQCRTRAIELMQSARGQEALAGMYYTELFGWLVGRLELGLSPAAPPEKLVERWKRLGDYRKERAALRKAG